MGLCGMKLKVDKPQATCMSPDRINITFATFQTLDIVETVLMVSRNDGLSILTLPYFQPGSSPRAETRNEALTKTNKGMNISAHHTRKF